MFFNIVVILQVLIKYVQPIRCSLQVLIKIAKVIPAIGTATPGLKISFSSEQER